MFGEEKRILKLEKSDRKPVTGGIIWYIMRTSGTAGQEKCKVIWCMETEDMAMAEILRKRSETDKAYQWKIEDLYENDELWQRDYELLKQKTGEFEQFRGRLKEGSRLFLDALRGMDELNMRFEKIYVYANQRLHEDTGNSRYQELSGKAQTLMVQLYGALAFMNPEILALPEETLEGYFREEPELGVYRHFVEELMRDRDHTLPAEQEELLARTGEMAEGPKDIFTMFNNADIQFPTIWGEEGEPIMVTHGNFISLLENQDREIRRAAFDSVYETYGKFKNTLAAMYRANVRQETFYASVRGYRSSLEAALYGNAIPVPVYDRLIETVNEHLPLLHRYVGLRKRLLGLDELHMYDLYVPMVSDADRKISFEEAKQLVKEGLAPLGEEYLAILQEGFDGGWIDVYENQGKKSGAYSWGAYGTHPYVLMNYHDNLNQVFTLAHEMGHAIHSYYSDKNQPYVYAGYRIFVAEVASTCNEALLIRHLMEKAEGKKEKAYLINYFLEQFRGTLYRQTMFAEFEKKTHAMEEAGEQLTAESLCRVYYELNRKYFGNEITVNEKIAMEWARIPHFYTPFYVYQYATGFSAAIALAGRILKEGTPAVEDYKKFLKGGSSAYPIELLRMAGVDMESAKPVREALRVFGDYLDELETLMA